MSEKGQAKYVLSMSLLMVKLANWIESWISQTAMDSSNAQNNRNDWLYENSDNTIPDKPMDLGSCFIGDMISYYIVRELPPLLGRRRRSLASVSVLTPKNDLNTDESLCSRVFLRRPFWEGFRR